MCGEACSYIGYIAFCGIFTVIHKLEKMLKEIVAYFKVVFQEFSWKARVTTRKYKNSHCGPKFESEASKT
jgi:hypothetical protein